MIIAGAVVGDIKDPNMLQRTCAKEITKEVVSKKVYKKQKMQCYHKGRSFSRHRAENICIKLQERQKHNYLNKRMIAEQEEKESKQESKQEEAKQEEVKQQEVKQQESKEESKLVSGQRKLKNLN